MNSNIIRPLLHTTKKEILDACEKDGLEFRNDSTNTDDKILRNHIRLNILPEFEKINPNYKRNLDDLMEYFKEMQINIENEMKSLII
jgi:tRNA(Ile)-lysidine synthase